MPKIIHQWCKRGQIICQHASVMSTHHREVNEPTAGVTRACFEASREINLLLTGTRAASQSESGPLHLLPFQDPQPQ